MKKSFEMIKSILVSACIAAITLFAAPAFAWDRDDYGGGHRRGPVYGNDGYGNYGGYNPNRHGDDDYYRPRHPHEWKNRPGKDTPWGSPENPGYGGKPSGGKSD